MGTTGSALYGVTGFVVGVEDPAHEYDYDDVWDWTILKDQPLVHTAIPQAAGPFETDTANINPEFEWGELDLEAIFGGDLIGNMEIFRRRELITFEKHPLGFHTNADISSLYYLPGDHFKTHIRGGPTVREPSVAMFGFSNPEMNQTGGSLKNTPTEQQWIMMQFAEVFLFDAWKYLMGLTAGSENDAANWFAELLEDAMIEDANYILPVGYVVTTKTTWDITVPGEPGNVVLTSE